MELLLFVIKHVQWCNGLPFMRKNVTLQTYYFNDILYENKFTYENIYPNLLHIRYECLSHYGIVMPYGDNLGQHWLGC